METVDNMATDEPVQQEMTPDVMPKRMLVAPPIKKGLSRDSVNKLRSIRFDPIDRMVMMYNEVTNAINNLIYDEEGNLKQKYSTVLYASLVATKQKTINDLMRYGYAPVSEKIVHELKRPAPLVIRLTKVGDVSSPDIVIGKEVEEEEDEFTTVVASDYSVDTDDTLLVPENKISTYKPKQKVEVPEGYELVELSAYTKSAPNKVIREAKLLERSGLDQSEDY
jgi:hypothetical protein